MTKITNHDKEKIISEFEMMKEFELSVKALYIKIVSSPDVKDQKIKDIFIKIADDEQRHSELVQKIINIATDAL
jgi:Mn-containing catalase